MSNEMKDLAKQSANNQQLAKQGTLSVVKNLLKSEAIKKKFEDILKDRAPQFTASIVGLISSSTNFSNVNPETIISAALVAATFDLPINPQLGYAHIVPYGDKASFQMGWKGYKQLAIRTGLYSTINSTDIREGELGKRNRLTGDIELNFIENAEERENAKIIGYANYFRLTTGYQSILYMSIEELLAHAKKYSKLYQLDLRKKTKLSKWSIPEELPSMCLKTVTKLNLSNNGILSIEMQKAKIADEAVVDEDGEPTEYPDSTNGIEASYEEVKELTPEEWENPQMIIQKIESFTDLKEFVEFLKTNEQRIDSISGKDGELIKAVVETRKQKL
jgi:recombination protein RecT